MIPSNLSFPSSLPPPPPSNPNPPRGKPSHSLSPRFSSPPPLIGARGSPCRCRRGGSSWDSNAESFRAGNFKFRDGGGRGGGREEDESGRSDKRRWWSDDLSDELSEDFDLFDDDPIEQYPWGMIWISKVFKSYGYLLPAIIASTLLATGPKAFLVALALPLGQSAISLAIDKLWGKAREGPRTKPKAKKNPFRRSNSDYRRQWQEQSNYRNQTKQGYQSRVSRGAGVADRVKGSGSSLGGWDELDRETGTAGYARQHPSAPNDSPQPQLMKQKLPKRGGRNRDVPLFLRLLIAVFPFLGSWTRVLW